MSRELTEAEARKHDDAFAKGWSLIENRILLHGAGPSGRPGWFSRWQLWLATSCFKQALAINPESWQAMWALGKIHQRLGEQAKALDWFLKAMAIHPEQPDVAREAGIAALDIGRHDEAIRCCRAAAACNPADPGLVCNLALAHCLAGQDAEAEECAVSAAQRDPTDGVTANVLAFVREVAGGKRPRPQRLVDAFPYG